MYKRIMVELKGDRNDGDILTLVQELVDSGYITQVLLVKRVHPAPVTAKCLLRTEEVTAENLRRQRDAYQYLYAVERAVHWQNVMHAKRVMISPSKPALEEAAEQEGYDLVLLPAPPPRCFWRWLWGHMTGHIKKAGIVPLAVYGRPSRRHANIGVRL